MISKIKEAIINFFKNIYLIIRIIFSFLGLLICGVIVVTICMSEDLFFKIKDLFR